MGAGRSPSNPCIKLGTVDAFRVSGSRRAESSQSLDNQDEGLGHRRSCTVHMADQIRLAVKYAEDQLETMSRFLYSKLDPKT